MLSLSEILIESCMSHFPVDFVVWWLLEIMSLVLRCLRPVPLGYTWGQRAPCQSRHVSKVAVLFQDIEPPVINGVQKPRKPGGELKSSHPNKIKLTIPLRLQRLGGGYCVYSSIEGT